MIQGFSIERSESTSAFESLKAGDKRRVVVVGPAGLGKSCAFAQVLRLLEGDHIPVLALRMDLQAQVLAADSLGKEMCLPMSPALVLAGVANGEMLKSPQEGPREIASRQIAVASFGETMAQEDLAVVIAGDEKCRIPAAAG